MVKTHKEVVVAAFVFLKKSTSPSSESSQRNAGNSTQQQTLEWTVNKSQFSDAEIRWVLQTVTKGNSKNSNNVTELFKVLFPGSQIAKNVYTWCWCYKWCYSWCYKCLHLVWIKKSI